MSGSPTIRWHARFWRSTQGVARRVGQSLTVAAMVACLALVGVGVSRTVSTFSSQNSEECSTEIGGEIGLCQVSPKRLRTRHCVTPTHIVVAHAVSLAEHSRGQFAASRSVSPTAIHLVGAGIGLRC